LIFICTSHFPFHVVKGNSICTPETNGAILPGITRKSIIEIALDLGYQVLIFSKL